MPSSRAAYFAFALYPLQIGSLRIVICRLRFTMPKKRRRDPFWSLRIGHIWIAWALE